MNTKKAFLSVIFSFSAAALIRSYYETRHIKLTGYKIKSDKLPSGQKTKFIFISDLHSCSYGQNNSKLIDLVKNADPDYIFIGGDLITAGKNSDDKQALCLLKSLKEICPVYMAMGNHEEYLKVERQRFGKRFDNILNALDELDIPLLDNKHADLSGNISVYGLEISRKYYKRFNAKSPREKDMALYLGYPDPERYNILLAHTPAFFGVYESWKADLVLCGHYHGGIIGFPCKNDSEKRRGLISPGFKILPEYCAGRFKKNKTDLIVSAGCGSHSINFRLNNKPEVVSIELSSKT